MLDEKCDNDMKRLEKEVARLGQENKDLRQRVLEVEGVNASQLDRIAGLERRKRLEDLGSGVAGAASVAGVEMPEEVPVDGERKRAKRVASTCDGEIEWKHLEAKGGERATSRGGLGPCQNCHGGTVLDHKEEEALKEMWSEWPLRMWPWISSLGSTLFSERGTRTWPDIEKKLTKREGRFLVWGSTKKIADVLLSLL